MKFSIKKTFSMLLFIVLTLVILGGWCNPTLAEIGSDPSANNDKKGYTPLTVLPGTTNSEGQVTIDSYIPGIFNLTIGIAGVLAVLMILIGGVEYITTDAIQGKSEGKARIQNALWGLVLVLVSWILLRTINPKLTEFDLTIKESTSSQSTNGDGDSINDSGSDSSNDNGGDDSVNDSSISSIDSSGDNSDDSNSDSSGPIQDSVAI